ncbi:ABC transporter permease [Streptomyces griseoaurantiacus]|jgi:ABC-2 type transport system permease protein|uniref:ABC transporter permease n=1 Tax=Streptomyces griseoaurantiacus TaxID=68213 RepID=UPI0032547E1F
MTDMLRYAKLDTLCLIRSAYFLTFSVLFSAGFYVMFTMVAQDAISDSPLFARDYMLSMSVSGAFFGALNGAGIRLGTERGEGWARQVLLTPLSGAAYLAAKALTAWLATLPAAVVVFALGAFANDVSMPAADWIAALAVIWGAGLVFVLAGLVVGLVAVGESAQYISLGVFFPLAMLGGLWFPLDDFPSALRHLADYLPTRALDQLATLVTPNAGDGPVLRPVLVLVCWGVALAGVVLSRSRAVVLARV